jgi:hypothetical protein
MEAQAKEFGRRSCKNKEMGPWSIYILSEFTTPGKEIVDNGKELGSDVGFGP